MSRGTPAASQARYARLKQERGDQLARTVDYIYNRPTSDQPFEPPAQPQALGNPLTYECGC
jgi:hypothetical protein